MTKLYKFLSIPLLIGLTLSIIFSYIHAEGEYYPLSPISTLGKFYYAHFTEPTVMLISIILWLLIGLLFYLTSFIFTHTDWSITRATLLHFIFSYIGLLPIVILAGWFSIKISNFLIFTFYFIIIYLMIWIKSYFTNNKYVTEINRQLNKREK